MRHLSFHSRRRRLQFSVLTTLLLACLSCVGCSQEKYKPPIYEDDSQVEKALKEAGATIKRQMVPFMPISQGAVVDLREIEIGPGIIDLVAQLDNLFELKVTGENFTDQSLAKLDQSKYLVTLELQGTAVTDAGLKHLAAFPKLTTLSLADTQVTAAGLKDVPNVTGLNLTNLSIGDGDIQNLAHLKKLELINLVGTQVTSAGLAELKKSRPGLMVFGVKPN